MDNRNFLISSDYPFDKVIYLESGSSTVASGSFAEVNIAHGLPFTPLLVGVWSTSSDFDTTYEQQAGPLAPFNFNSPILYGFDVTSTSTNARVFITNYTSGSSVTVYYRIYGFQPSTSNVDLSPTSSAGDDFVINSDYNYTKLISVGRESLPDTFGSPTTLTITHGLGYMPQVVYWVERAGTIQRGSQVSIFGSGIRLRVTDTQVLITSELSVAANVHYRIYADE